MKKEPRITFVICLFCIVVAGASVSAGSGDWPSYRHDLMRSGCSEEALAPQLHLQWTFQSPHAPRPAWPEPGRELNRLDFDYAFQVVSAGGAVYFGSSADHKVYALDLKTGEERWSFFTEGPVRFAPQVADGRVYAASDDGMLYCLSADKGGCIWSFRGGPRDERILGNEQMISRWPLRSAVGLIDGTVYLAAGMWPGEGVYLYALDAETGKLIWRNSTSGIKYTMQPHPGSFSMSNVAPQGYLLANTDQLFIPTGRNLPAVYDLANGNLLYCRTQPTQWADRWGGTWNLLYKDLHFNWSTHVGPDIDILLDEYTPDPNDGMVAFDARMGREKKVFKGKIRMVISDDVMYAAGKNAIGAYTLEGVNLKKRWEKKCPYSYEIIKAGDTIYTGAGGSVAAHDGNNGKLIWRKKIEGQARGLAAAGGRLLVSTTGGEILSFGPDAVERKKANAPKKSPVSAPAENVVRGVREIVDATGKKEGWCLVVGIDDDAFPAALARHTGFNIVCVEDDAGKAASARNSLDAAGLYGVRVTVHKGSLGSIEYPRYFADLIITDGKTALSNLFPLLHPCRGVIYERSRRKRVLRAPGKLPGAGSWTHQYADAARTGCSDDRRVNVPVSMLWFGKPGPARLIARHWAGPAPLSVNGRMFIIGQKSIIAVDTYNGRTLWMRTFDKAGRWPVHSRDNNFAADRDALYFARGRKCLHLDAATGKTVEEYDLPKRPNGLPEDVYASLKWSYLAVSGDFLLGSIGDERQSRCVFVLDKKTGDPLWSYVTANVIACHAIAADDKVLYLLDKTPAGVISQARRRGRNVTPECALIAFDLHSGKKLWQAEEGLAARSAISLSEGVLVATGGNGATAFKAKTGALLYNRSMVMQKFPLFVGDTIFGAPFAYDLYTGERKSRTLPFAEAKSPWTVTKGYGCGSFSAGSNVLLFRSSTLGMYDLEGDSGIRNYGGIRPGCYVNAIASNGLVLMSPADAACTCSYNFQATIALLPEEKQKEWSIFYDRLPETEVKHAALNLGAPGDRKDSSGRLWIAAPRPGTRAQRASFAAPFRFRFANHAGAYRVNEKEVSVAGTDRHWIYTNGLAGPLQLEFDLDIFERGFTCWPVGKAPVVDGKLDDGVWDGYRAVSTGQENTEVTLRYDEHHLYAAFKKQASQNPGDAFELFLCKYPENTSFGSKLYYRFTLPAGGKSRAAKWTYVSPFGVCDIPKVDVKVDGRADDWKGRGLAVHSLPSPKGTMRAPADFDPSFRIGWNEEGIVVLAEVRDDEVIEAENPGKLSAGDSLEFFLSPAWGSKEAYQVIVSPGADPRHPKARSWFYDARTSVRTHELRVDAEGRKTADGYVLEVLLPWTNIDIDPAVGKEIAMQVFATDGGKNGKSRFQVRLYPGGNPISGKNPFALQEFRLAEKPSAPIRFHRKPKPASDGLYRVAAPLPFPNTVPAMGGEGEKLLPGFVWRHKVRKTGDTVTAEIAIPWSSLEGLHRSWLMASAVRREALSERPYLKRGFERLLLVPREKAAPRNVSLRLHFAELEDAKPGERVFDVMVNGATVLDDVDIFRQAGGAKKALVKEIRNVTVSRMVELELLPAASEGGGSGKTPVISGIEILQE